MLMLEHDFTEVVDLDRAACYRALCTRDARFDGRFYTAVVSTGIYCRPICPARTPKLENCLFLPSAAAAHQMGFRPCLRCRPEIAPGLAGWRGSANTVSRALHLIAEGRFEDGGVDSLASRVGVSSRHLRRLFDRHVGASPLSVAQAHRVLFAKRLITETSLSITQIGLAAGFKSVRRFNDVFRTTYQRTPRELRRTRRAEPGGPEVVLKLPFSPPYDWRAMLEFLAGRAIPGVERVHAGCYLRTFALNGARGTVEVRALLGEHSLTATIRTDDVRALSPVVARLRRLFDLDADIAAIDEHLRRDPKLARLVRARPGLRVPGAWDSFELAVRAVLGQQISVKAATTLAGRLASRAGEPLGASVTSDGAPHVLFPTPAAVAQTDLTGIGLTSARCASLNALARTVAADNHVLDGYETLEATKNKLAMLPGIGPWTAQYIAMRALREPDAFPASDLGLLRAMTNGTRRPTPAALTKRAEAWRPWRAYAALRLWMQGEETRL